MNETNDLILLGTSYIAVKFRKSQRAKRLQIRIINHTRQVEVVIPYLFSFSYAKDFLIKNQGWVISKLGNKLNIQISLSANQSITFLEQNYHIIYSEKLRGITYLDGNNIIVSGDCNFLTEKIKKFLCQMLHKEIEQIALYYATKIGVNYKKIILRDNYSLWGSCNKYGVLSFNWRLGFVDKNLLEYVIVHELCHLIEMNHSSKFWQLVAKQLPNYLSLRKILRSHNIVIN